MQINKQKTIEFAVVSALFICIAIFYFGTDLNHLLYFITPGDINQMYWNTCNFRNSMVQGSSPFFTNELLYPYGVGLHMHTYTMCFGFVNLLLNNPILSINLVIFLNVISAAVGFYYLSKRWLKSNVFQFLVGFIAVFNGYILAKVGIHYNLILIGLVPWTILLFLHSLDSDKVAILNKRKLVLSILFLCLNWFFDFYAVLYVLSFVFLWFSYHWILVKWFKNITKKQIAGLFISVFSIHILSRILFLNGFDKKGGIWESADIRQFLIPGALGKYANQEVSYIHSPITENFVFCGFTLFLLLIVSLVIYTKKSKNDRKNGIFLFLILLYFSLIFPDVKWNGNHVFFMPTSWIHYVPFLDNLRGPSRFVELFYIVSILFVGIQLEGLFIAKRKTISIIGIAILLGFYFDYSTKNKRIISNQDFKLSASDKKYLEKKTALTFPIGIKDGLHSIGEFNSHDYILSASLNVKLFSGYISRIPTSTWNKIEKDNTLNKLIQLQNNPNSDFSKTVEAEVVRWLNMNKVDVLRIDTQMLKSKNLIQLFKNIANSNIEKCSFISENEIDYILWNSKE